jgi:hypothetical protein
MGLLIEYGEPGCDAGDVTQTKSEGLRAECRRTSEFLRCAAQQM